MSLDYRYLFVAWLDHLSAFSCNDIAFTGDTPIFATGKNPTVFAKNGTPHEKETELTNVRGGKYCVSTHKTQQEKQKQLRPCGKCFATLVSAQQGVKYL